MTKALLLTINCLLFQIVFGQTDTLIKYNFTKKYSVSQQQKDLNALKTTLENTHPGLYWYTSKSIFEKEYKKLYDNIKTERTEYQFHNYILPLLAQIHCSHTKTELSYDGEKFRAEKQKRFPLNIKIFNGRLYIKDNFSDDTLFAAGDEILTINGIQSINLISVLRKNCWVDGLNPSAELISLEYNFQKLIEYHFDFPLNYSVKIKRQNKIIDTNINAVYHDGFIDKYYKKYPNRPNQTLTLIDSLKTAILTIPNFIDTAFVTFLKQSFETLKDKKTENLIIDVRKNTGGYDPYGMYLYSYIALKPFNYYDHVELIVHNPEDTVFQYGHFGDPIEVINDRLKNYKLMPNGKYYLEKSQHPCLTGAPFQPEQNSFKNNIYVLTDGRSFSGTSEFCSIANYNKRAKFIGQTTGGGHCGNSSGWTFFLTLPNTNIRIFIPVCRYLSAVGNCQHKSGIKPDFEITPSISDFMTNTDREMKFALDLIKTTTQQKTK